MIRDITIGQYYPGNSIVHRLDPRVKLVGTIFYIVSLFVFGSQSFIGFIPAGFFLFGSIALSRVPIKFMLKGLKAVLFLLIFTMSFNLFLTPGNEIFRFGFIRITDKGLWTSGFMGMRLTFLVLGSTIMTLTTTPNQLTDGMERLFSPLRIFKIPVHEIAMMMSIALRFIPILLEETDKIMKAQQARGADFESGNIFRRAKAMVPILVPLFVSAFRRAGDLAQSMEARCYHGGKGRTQMKPLHYKGRDFVAYCIIVLYLTGMVLIKIFVSS